MSDTLFGSVESGTPLETRAGASQMASFLQSVLSGNTDRLNPFQRLGAQSFSNLFGVTPGDVGVSGVVTDLLRDPSSHTSDMFAAMRPFENRQTKEAVAGTRAMFGTAGGRFSRNAADAEARVRGELADQFGLNRQQALLQAQQQRGNFLANLFGLAGQNQQMSMMPLQLAAQFMQPGAPVVREGLLPGIISAAGNIYAGRQFAGGGGGGQYIPPTPYPVGDPGDPFGPGGSHY